MNLHGVYLDWIDQQESRLKHRLQRWVNVNTFSLNIAGLDHFLAMLREDFKFLGGCEEICSLKTSIRLTEGGNLRPLLLGKALRIYKRPTASMQVLLCGHMDTVYSPDHAFQSLQKIKKNKWKGPGIADMKGGIAILLTALEALERSPFASQIGWEVLLTPDEEIGSPGSAYLYEEAAKRHSFGLVFEPSFPDGSFVTERKGSVTYSVIIEGVSAHVGRDFDKGKSAAIPLARLILRLNSLQEEDLTINVAEIEAKGPVNIVLGQAQCRVNFRSSNEQLLAKTIKQLEEFVEDINQTEGVTLTIFQDCFRAPKPFHSRTQTLFESYKSCAEDLNLPFKTCTTAGVCDGNILESAGLPTLDTAGAVGGHLHTSNEYIIFSSLTERAKIAALFLFKLASHELNLSGCKND